MKTKFYYEFLEFKKRVSRELWILQNPELFKYNEKVIIYAGESYERTAYYKGECMIEVKQTLIGGCIYYHPYRICFLEENEHVYQMEERYISKLKDQNYGKENSKD